MDIVERLRDAEQWNATAQMKDIALFGQAADEIEKLREDRNRLRESLQMLVNACENGWHPTKINGAELFTARAALKESE